MSHVTVPVALGARSYDIHVGAGLLLKADEHILPVLRQKRAVIVTDENVAGLHLVKLEAALDRAGVKRDTIVLPPGEHTKDFSFLQKLLNDLLDLGVERRTMLIALGGGVIGDLTGFAASVVRRGVDYVQVPTTLLAQVDSSVGGKTAINSGKGKNLIGAFYQPIHVVADTALLDTLPKRDFRAGYAEVVKYGLLGDREFFEWLEANWQDVFAGGPARGNLPAPREYAVLKSVQAKADIVARDEHEHGDRMLLNLGHTFGHAFEAAAGYSTRLLHGEAVALGMSLAFEFSARKGLIPQADADRVIKHLAAVGLPTHVKDVPGEWPDVDAMMELISQDKKVKRGRLTFILVRGIGQAFVTRDVEAAEIRAFLAEKLAQR
jgi:3-dehydroquinate synthase